MLRKLMTGVIAAALVLLGTATVGSVGAAGAATPTPLNLPQGLAFAVLGHSCGGIGEQSFATGFDPTSGYPVGDVYLSTTCSTGGRGSHPATFTAWVGVTWDFTAAVVSYGALSTGPSVDPTFSAFDANGNEIYNVSNNAYLLLGPNYVPVPRLISLSGTIGPASGGTSVTISGTGFTGATAVAFGGTAAASFVVNGDTSITVVTPVTGAGTVDVTVTTAGGTNALSPNDRFTFVATPTVSSVSPNRGTIWGSTSVTITGTHFTAVNSVQFGGTGTSFTINSDTSITALSPVGETPADTVDVTVSSIGGTSATSSADQFTYIALVQCAKLSGTLTGAISISKCTPASASIKSASSASLAKGTLTWSASGQTTVANLNPLVSRGQGGCSKKSTEQDLYGSVTGGTSTYTAPGAPIAARICVATSGKVSLVKGTTFTV